MIDRAEIPMLVVDDDEALRSMIVNVLKHAGFKRISQAGCVKEAKEALCIADIALPDSRTVVMDEPGVLLLDVMLPDDSGFSLCKELKEKRPSTMVLMMSGFDIEGLNQKLVDSEADDFLTKPFNAQELVARIEMLAAKMRRIETRSIAAASNAPGPGGNRIPHIGDFIGPYMILDSLGWGKNSVIYKAVKKGASDIVAIKLLTKYSMEFKDVVKRFEVERSVMARLKHPNLIQFIETGVWDGCPFIVMECVRGVNLEERLVTDGIPNAALALSAAIQIGTGLAAMHDFNALHRDIKLKNVMFDPETTTFKLTDFGIARFMEYDAGITCDGFIVGTPIYMAPEIFRGEEASVESDIYSYGATIYHFAAGVPPFSAKRNADMYKKHRSEDPKPIHSFNPLLPKEFDALIAGRCMAKSPSDRPASMDEVVEALSNIKLQ